MFAVGDRIRLHDSVSESKAALPDKAKLILSAGAEGVVTVVPMQQGFRIIDFDVPEKLPEGITVLDYKQWWVPLRDMLPAGKAGEDDMLRIRRDNLANEYTNSTSYEELGIGLKGLVDRLIEAEDKLETIHNISKKAKK